MTSQTPNNLNKQDSLSKIFPFSRADSNQNLNGSLQSGAKRKEGYLKSGLNGFVFPNGRQNNESDSQQEKKTNTLVKEALSEEGDKEEDEQQLSSFSKRFKRVAWYHFIHTVSVALSLWKGALVYSNINEAKVKQLEVLDDKAYYESEWSKQLKLEKEQRKRKTVVFTYQSKFWRKLKKNTRQLRKTIRYFQLKFSEFRQNMYSNTKKALRVIPIFDPVGNLILWWDFFNFIFGIFLYVYLPFTVSFEDEGSGILRTKAPLWDILVIFLILDILKNCNTAIYLKGELIKEHLLIFKNYIVSFDLILDIFTMISAINLLEISYFKAFYLLRIFYQQSLIEKFKDALSMSEKSIAIIDLLKLFATVLYLCHVVACVWHKMGQLEQEYTSAGWIVKYAYQDQDTYTLYVNSYFYAIIMMSSVKGNIQPTTNTEKILSTILAFGACVLFGYTITSITIILRNINTKRDNFNALLQRVNKYMRQYNVDANYQSRARKYVEYVKDSSLDEKRSSQSVLNCLSKSLRDEIFIDIYSQSLRKIPFFASYFSKDCLKVLALKMSSQFYASDEVIVDCHKVGEPSLFILVEGEVEEFFYPHEETSIPSNNLKQISTKTKGQVLCEFEFFSQCYRPVKLAKSKGVSELHVLKLKDFTDVIQQFPEELEHYVNVKDQIAFYRQMNKIDLECILCNQDNHIESECPRTFYVSRKIALRRKLGAAPKAQIKKILGFHRKQIKLFYHSLLSNKTIIREINGYFKQDIQPDNPNKQLVSQKKRQQQKERKMLIVLDKYNQHIMQNVEKEFIMNALSPEATQTQSNDDMCQLIMVQGTDQKVSSRGQNSTKNISSDNPDNIIEGDLESKADSPFSDSKDSYDPLTQKSQQQLFGQPSPNFFTSPNSYPEQTAVFDLSNNHLAVSPNLIYDQNLPPGDYLKQQRQNKVNSFKRDNSKRKSQLIPSLTQIPTYKSHIPPGLEDPEEIKIQVIGTKKKLIGKLEPIFHPKALISELSHPSSELERIKSNTDSIYEDDIPDDKKEKVIQRQPISLAVSKIAEFEIYFPHNNFSNVLKQELQEDRLGNNAFQNTLRKSRQEKTRVLLTTRVLLPGK